MLIDILAAVMLALMLGVPVVMLIDKWKKEMDEDERGDE